MPKTRRRSLVSLSKQELDLLLIEAAKKGLKLATYLRTVVVVHLQGLNKPEPRRGAGTR